MNEVNVNNVTEAAVTVVAAALAKAVTVNELNVSEAPLTVTVVAVTVEVSKWATEVGKKVGDKRGGGCDATTIDSPKLWSLRNQSIGRFSSSSRYLRHK